MPILWAGKFLWEPWPSWRQPWGRSVGFQPEAMACRFRQGRRQQWMLRMSGMPGLFSPGCRASCYCARAWERPWQAYRVFPQGSPRLPGLAVGPPPELPLRRFQHCRFWPWRCGGLCPCAGPEHVWPWPGCPRRLQGLGPGFLQPCACRPAPWGRLRCRHFPWSCRQPSARRALLGAERVLFWRPVF